MKKILFLFLLALITFNGIAQHGNVSPKSNITKGKLPNGITYYLYRNPVYDNPALLNKGKANLYIIQNVGAILEEDNQNGLAHFLEHMAFNGTKNFPNHSIMEMFEKNSLKHCINAYTGIDKTVYHFTNVPTSNMAFVDACLFILRDWTDYLTLDSLAIENERPVILEEMRMRNTTNFRISEQMSPIIYNHTKYCKRNIIGKANLIKNFKREQLYDFYRDWYRTDLQAIVVVGDIDLKLTEQKIKNLFSPVKPLENQKERYHIEIPDNEEILYKQIKDKEINNGCFNIECRHKCQRGCESTLYNVLINQLLSKRIAKMLDKDSLNFVNCYIKNAPMQYGQNYSSYVINLTYKKNRDRQALKTLFSLHKDVLENGFTQKEYDEATKFIHKGLKGNSNYYNFMSNSYIFESIKRNFIYNEDIIHPIEMLKEFEKLSKNNNTISIKNKINELYFGKNKSIIVIGNVKDTLLSKDEICKIEKGAKPKAYIPEYNNTEKSKVEFPVDKLSSKKIISKENIKEFNAKKWKLENGATIIYKYNDTDPNAISIYATSDGGYSVLDKKYLENAMAFSSFNSMFGVEGIDKKKLDKFLKDNGISFSVRLNSNDESIYLNGRHQNINDLFKILYCAFEKKSFSKKKYSKTIEDFIETFRNKPTTFEIALRDSINHIIKGKDRFVTSSEGIIQSMSFDKLKYIYNDRFKDASNFTFYIVGAIGESKAKKLAQKYIGNIKSLNTNENYKTLTSAFPKGVTAKTFKFKMDDPKAGVYCYLNTNKEFSFDLLYRYNILQMILSDKLQKVIRDLERGTYNVALDFYHNFKSLKDWGFCVNFVCDPERTDQLNETLKIAIDVLKERGISKEDFKIYKDMLHPSKNHINKNSIYINYLYDLINWGEDKSDINYFIDKFKNITYEEITKELKDFLNKADMLNIIYKPK